MAKGPVGSTYALCADIKPQPGPSVCQKCLAGPFSSESFRKLIDTGGLTYDTTWSKVQAAADGGCGLCSLLITDKETHKDEVAFKLRFGTVDPVNTGFHHITPAGAQCLSVQVDEYEIDISNNGYYLSTCPDDPAAAEIVAREPLRDVGSKQSSALALECLQHCLHNHEKCPKPILVAPLPTRLIDCSDPHHPRLFLSSGGIGTYAALSYVWGGKQPNCSTKENIEIYMNHGISIDLLPATIRDAVQATKGYGLQYLWVDAYCIIQNSREDKNVELTRLRGIFRNAYITLIASCAESASTGFLQDRSPPTTAHPRLPFWCKDGRLGSVYAYPIYDGYSGRREAVNQRAWCLEERLLSPRKLVYASDTLQYHCQTAITYIGGALAVPRDAERLMGAMFSVDDDLAERVAEWKMKDWRELRMQWIAVVFNYTRRVVTKPKDKLTALAAVAEQFHLVWRLATASALTGFNFDGQPQLHTGAYLAGLWKHSLLQDLLWLKSAFSLCERPSLYLGPSWSWASVDGEVSLYQSSDLRVDQTYIGNNGQLKHCSISKCEVELEDERLPYGRVTSAVLVLSSTMIRIDWQADIYDLDPEINFEGEAIAKLFVRRDDIRVDAVVISNRQEDIDKSYLCVGNAYPDCREELINAEIWALPIVWNIGPAPGDIHAAGLFVTNAANGQFRRVGSWETPDSLVDVDSEADRRPMFAWFEPSEETQTSMCTIEIV